MPPPGTDDARPSLSDVERLLLARAPESAIRPDLVPMRALVDAMGDPQATFPVIHVAGTNGKTSTARMIESILRAYGMRTGLYTSPHLERITERIAIDGDPISAAAFLAAWRDVEPFLALVESRDGLTRPLTFFEAMTAVAFAAFADAPVHAAVVEVGLGGAWDATNVVDPAVAVVTPVGLDHQDWLGDDLAAIAGQKAGILKPGSFAVLAQQEVPAAEVLLRQAAEMECPVAREGIEFGVLDRRVAVGGQMLTLRGIAGDYDEVFLPLFGAHQAHNAAVALAAAEAFLGEGRDQLDPEVVRAGFAQVTSPGRLEVVRRSPTVVLDAAHNPHGARALAEAVGDAFSFTRLVGVVGVLADKDARGILEALEPVLAEIVVTRSTSPRALDPDTLAGVAVDVFGEDRVEVAPGLADALDRGIALAEEEGDLGGAGVLVTGSVTVAGEARALLHGATDADA